MVKNSKNIQSKDGERIGIFGASGSGKTTKARQLLKAGNRIIIFDSVKKEWETHGDKWLSRKCQIAHSVAEFKSLLLTNFSRKTFCLVFAPIFANEQEQLDVICKWIFNIQAQYGITHNSTITLFVEEAQEAIPSGLSRTNSKHHALIVAKMGRARGINLIVASQRIKTIDIQVRANLSYYYFFRLAELADINEANQYVRNKEMLFKLPNLTYFLITPNGQQIKGAI